MKTNFLKTQKDITNWLNKYEVKNYTLVEDPTYGFVVDVLGGVNLSDQSFDFIPVKFNTVSFDFYCENNKLTSLEFCPTTIGCDFWCGSNLLTSLEFCPTQVGGQFLCQDNQLSSLKFCPTTIGDDFFCNDNQLTSLEYCPQSVGGRFYFNNNQISSLDFCPLEVGEEFFGGNNPLLGYLQDINVFSEILKIREQIANIKKEKADITEQLDKISSDVVVASKIILKI